MRCLFVSALGIGLTLQSMPSHAREMRRLAPSSQWIVDYADDSCRLARRFGEGDRQVTLIMDQFTPGDSFKPMLVGKQLVPRDDELVIRWGLEEEQKVGVVSGTTRDVPTIFIEATMKISDIWNAKEFARALAEQHSVHIVPPIGAAREKAVTSVEFHMLAGFDLVLETGPMDLALDALRKCSWDMVAKWGLDVEQQKRLTRRPTPTRSWSTWFDHRDYPREMLRRGIQAIVNFRVLVDGTGKPTSCHVQTSSQPQEFDVMVCRSVMKRARFEPALDADGRPVPSYWRQTVNYRIGWP